MLRAVGHWHGPLLDTAVALGWCRPMPIARSQTILVYGRRRGIVVMSLGASSKLLNGEPAVSTRVYRLRHVISHPDQLSLLPSAEWEMSRLPTKVR